MSRLLAPSTIIPAHLYVKRDADRQTKNVVLEMGRPGYVLVARQMGKTNLLLNTRRELEDAGTAFVYVDLSQRFSDERQCFRAIIDTALSVHSDRFKGVLSAIRTGRSDSLSPQREHEEELRLLLSVISDRLVVVLDEIDSLTSASFSDRLFAQIRSIYFLRANISEFNKLTYLLSGVMEPTDIIKDSKISPFNIGEKIYLDDFSKEEMADFLSKANLSLGAEPVERLWHWTGGNPRLLWDVCSEIELLAIGGQKILDDSIDAIVQRLYLSDFLRPPIDHIRQLVESDNALREAIEVIRYGKGGELHESTKSKLYLAGITSSRLRHNGNEIKNRIVSSALSDRWLREVAVKKKGLLFLAVEQYSRHNYADALVLYQQYLEHNNGDLAIHICNEMGWCHRHLGNPDAALKIIKENRANQADDPTEYLEQRLLEAVCLLSKSKRDEAQDILREIVSSGRTDPTIVAACINLGSLLRLDKTHESNQKAESLFQKAIELLQNEKLRTAIDRRKSLLTAARWSYAHVLNDEGRTDDAIKQLTMAISEASLTEKPCVLIFLGKISPQDYRIQLFREAAQLIVENAIVPEESDSGPYTNLKLGPDNLYDLLSEMYFLDRSAGESLLTYLLSGVKPFSSSRAALYVSVALTRFNEKSIAETFLNEALGAEPSKPIRVRALALMFILERSNNLKLLQDFNKALLATSSAETFIGIEFRVISESMSLLVKQERYDRCLEIANHLHSIKDTISSEVILNFASVHFFEMIALRAIGKKTQLIMAADSTLEFLKKSDIALQQSNLNKTDLEVIQQFAELHSSQSFLFSKALPVIKNVSKPNRNQWVKVRYLDGQEQRDKYKRLQSDIETGRCVVIDDA